MPRVITNRLTITGEHNRIRELLQMVQHSEEQPGTFDFKKVMPVPAALNIECGAGTFTGLRMYRHFIEEEAPKSENRILAEIDFLEKHPTLTAAMWVAGKQAYENLQNYGVSTWVDFCLDRWGTSWNAFDVEGGFSKTDRNQAVLTFHTGYSPAKPVIQKLSRIFADLEFLYEWVDEDLLGYHGYTEYELGQVTDEGIFESNPERMEFALHLLGGTATDYGYVQNPETGLYEKA